MVENSRLKKIREDIFKDDESLMEAEKIRQDILKRGIDNIPVHQLSDAVLTIAIYLVNIGQLFVDLGDLADDIDEEYERMVDDKYLELKSSGDYTEVMAKAEAKKACRDKKDECMKKRASYNAVMRYYKDLERIVSTAQSRIRVASSEGVRSTTQ